MDFVPIVSSRFVCQQAFVRVEEERVRRYYLTQAISHSQQAYHIGPFRDRAG